MIRIIALFFFAEAVLFSCTKPHSAAEYTRDAAGYYYKLLEIGDGNVKPGKESVLFCDVTASLTSDSVFFNSKYTGAEGFYIKLPGTKPASGKSYFLKAAEGDSISLMVPAGAFFRDYFDTLVPAFCKGDSLVKFNVKINRFLSPAQYNNMLQSVSQAVIEDRELHELMQIDAYLQLHYPEVEPDAYGLYTLEHSGGGTEKISAGKRVKISYSGTYLDGKPADIGSPNFEFIFGTPDQLVKGLNIVIGSLKKDETTKIIVPSRLAFGELGSSNESVPPYTSLVYNIKIIDIK